ncbi:alcohol oxidase [Trametes meyenii]|nr:alcohol oxidase [Trametes meyenii]
MLNTLVQVVERPELPCQQEAGVLHLDDENIDAPGLSGVGNPAYDWNFVSTPQTFASGRNLTIPRGKMLGGSSGINGMAWGRASAIEYDAWGALARDDTWGWSGLLPYMRKSEKVSASPLNPYPGISRSDASRAQNATSHADGFSGPIKASYNSHYFEVTPAMVKTMNNLGIRTNAKPLAGNATGVINTRASIDRAAGARSYSATAYYCSHAAHTNYHVLLDAQATKIIFSKTPVGLSATGVEFISGTGRFVARVRKEVILSAGAVQTPQILELSGIGNTTILGAHNITTLVDLPQVGENFQEHLYVGAQWKLLPGVDTFDILRNNASFAAEQALQYTQNRTGLLADTDSLVAFLPLQDFVGPNRLKLLLNTFDDDSRIGRVTSLQRHQYEVQREWLARDHVAAVELIQWSKGFIHPEDGASYVVLLGGIVHISSDNPLAAPAINPNFLSRPFDTQVLVDVLKFLQKLGRTAPFSHFVDVQTDPDPATQTDEDLIAYIRASASGGDHLVGTAAMAPRDRGGVVDATLTVYGTTNVRVVDASIFPIHIAAHTQATVYAIAEKALGLLRPNRKL